MDLNQLLFQQQRAIIDYAASKTSSLKGSQFDLVRHYERRITRLRHDMGVADYPAWI